MSTSQTHHTGRRAGGGMLAVLLAAAVTLVPAESAQAAVTVATCVGTATSTYEPPLTSAGRATTITVDQQLTSCVAPGTDVTSGSTLIVANATNYPCTQLLQSGTLTQTITWNTGQTSTLTGNYEASFVGATIVGTGTGSVSAGLFVGASFIDLRVTPSAAITLCAAGLGTVASTQATTELTFTAV